MVDSIKLLVVDINNALTDGKIIVDHHGNISKSFSRMDLDAMKLARKSGIEVAVIADKIDLCDQFLSKDFIVFAGDKYQEIFHKQTVFGALNIAYISNSYYDRPILKTVGWGFCPSNSEPAVKSACQTVLQARSGDGAVAESIELIYNTVLLKD